MNLDRSFLGMLEDLDWHILHDGSGYPGAYTPDGRLMIHETPGQGCLLTGSPHRYARLADAVEAAWLALPLAQRKGT